MTSSEYLIWGIVIHLIIDWLLQNDWIANNKANLRSPAGYLHGASHSVGMLLIFPLPIALLIGVSHWVIDLRFIMAQYRKWFRQTTEGPFAIPVAIWGDQVVHIAIIAIAALVAA